MSALTYCFILFPLAFLQCCFAFYCGAVQVWQFLVLHFFHWIFAVFLLWWILFKVGRSPLHFFALVDFVQSGAISRSSRSPHCTSCCSTLVVEFVAKARREFCTKCSTWEEFLQRIPQLSSFFTHFKGVLYKQVVENVEWRVFLTFFTHLKGIKCSQKTIYSKTLSHI